MSQRELDSTDEANQEQLRHLQQEIQEKMLEAKDMVSGKKAMSESGHASSHLRRKINPDESFQMAASELNETMVAKNNVIHMKNMILELQQVLATKAQYASEVEKINFMLKNMHKMQHSEVIFFFKRYETKFKRNSDVLMRVSFILRILEKDVTAHQHIVYSKDNEMSFQAMMRKNEIEKQNS